MVKTLNSLNDSINYFLTPGTKEHSLQKVLMIITTPRGSLPLDRLFGYDPKMVDKPFIIAYAAIKYDLKEQFKKYCPEVKLRDVLLEKTSNIDEGQFNIKVEVEVN